MKQLLIISGKGGTGKTTLATAFIKLGQPSAFADCDVEAPNLHLLLEMPDLGKITDYYGMDKAGIDRDICVGCGLCATYCRFGAIKKQGNYYGIESIKCEGCGVCEYICPEKAITMEQVVSGKLKLYTTKDYIFSTARLRMGYGVSGKLVASVKKQLLDAVDQTVQTKEKHLVVIDGSPGIGCPVIASLSGVDMALIVTEPSVSGISDLKRLIQTAKIFKIALSVCINKYDIDRDNSNLIQQLCEDENIPMVGKIPFDTNAFEAAKNGRSVIDYNSGATEAIKQIWTNLIKQL